MSGLVSEAVDLGRLFPRFDRDTADQSRVGLEKKQLRIGAQNGWRGGRFSWSEDRWLFRHISFTWIEEYCLKFRGRVTARMAGFRGIDAWKLP